MKNFLYVIGAILAITALSCKKNLKVSPVPEEERYIAPCTVKLDTVIIENDSINGDLIPRHYPIDSVYGEYSNSDHVFYIHLDMGTNYLYSVRLSFEEDVNFTNNIFDTDPDYGLPEFRQTALNFATSDGHYESIPNGTVYMQKQPNGSFYISLCDIAIARYPSLSITADTARVTTSFYFTP